MNRKTIVLLLSFVGLAVLVLAVKLWPRSGSGPDLRIKGWSEGRKVEKAEEEAPYDRIEVETGGNKVTLSRGANRKWTMTPPEGARADSYKVRQIADAFREGVTSVVSSRVSSGGADLAAFGLDDATRVKVVLSKGGADPVALEIGSVQKPEEGRYGEGDTFVRVPGQDRAYRLIRKDLRRPFEDGIRGLRDRKVFDFEASDVARAEVRNPAAPDGTDRAFALASEEKPGGEAKDGDGEKKKPERAWRFEVPGGVPAGDVRGWLSSMAGLYAQEYVDDLPKDVAIGDDAYAIELKLADGRAVSLALSVTAGDSAYVRVGGMAGYAKVAKYTADQMRKKLLDLHDKSLFRAKREEVEAFDVRDGGKRVAWVREGNGYRAIEPAGMPLNRATVEQVLADVESLKADAFLPPSQVAGADTGLDAPAVTASVRLKDGRTYVLEVGKEKDKGVFYARVTGLPHVATIAQWMLGKVRKSPADLRNKKVFAFAEADVASVDLVHKDETVRLVREPAKAEGGEAVWKATAPQAEAALKPDAVRTLVAALAGLTAKDFAPDKQPAAVGLGGSGQDMSVTVTLADGSRHVLRVSADRKDGDPYAVTPTEKDFKGAVFTLNQYQVRNFQKRLKELQ
ncbi:MAG: DUF4340 domain-containing protein [Deltaproteobacteria bacterium]|nr:DUF4340 domain-containing protein [Deltaproteobacteria bacterium]